jgi:hypothetical protein
MSDVESDAEKELKMTKGDHAHTLVRAGFSAIPVIGGSLEILYGKYFPAPIDERRDKLLVSVTNAVQELREKHSELAPEALAKNELFTTVLLQAVNIAIRNHQEEKREALRNAVLNTALKINIDENMQLTFLRYIDDLTPLHLKIVKLFESPKKYLQEVGRPFPDNIVSTGLDHLIEHAIPELHKRHEAIRITFHDLFNYGLVNTKADTLGGLMSVGEGGIFAQRTTDTAREFLRYISAPKELSNE